MFGMKSFQKSIVLCHQGSFQNNLHPPFLARQYWSHHVNFNRNTMNNIRNKYGSRANFSITKSYNFLLTFLSRSLLLSGFIFTTYLTYQTYDTFTNPKAISSIGWEAWEKFNNSFDQNKESHSSEEKVKAYSEYLKENVNHFTEPNQLFSEILTKNHIFADSNIMDEADENIDFNGSKFNQNFERNPPIYRIVLTGGPCAGKSTAMETLRIRLNSIGFQVLTLPELATMFIGSGVKFPQFVPMTSDQILELQSCMVHAQMSLEDVYYRLAKSSNEPTLILCDRGIIDGRAYMTPLEFQVMLDSNDWNLMQLRDQRYDCVIHLVSAAIGAESFYTLENNKARSESIYQAQMIDKKLREVYIGHPYLFVVNNQTNFEDKIEKVVNIVGSIIGMPKKIGSRRKFLLKEDAKDSDFNVPFEKIDVEHVFLRSDDPNEHCGIRKRTHQYVNSYSIVYKVKTQNGKEETNVFRRLTPKTYMQFMKQADPNKRKTKKIQKSFVWGDHYYVLNRYKLKTQPDVNVLVVEARPEEEAETLIPDFLKDLVIEEVTPGDGEEDRFGLHHFAYHDRKTDQQ